MNRNNVRKIAERLMLLQDFFIKNADKTHAVSMEDIPRYYLENGIEGENSELVNIKTVYRDLDALGAYYGLDIAYSEKHKGYILGRRSRCKTACTRKGAGCFGAAGQIRIESCAFYVMSFDVKM